MHLYLPTSWPKAACRAYAHGKYLDWAYIIARKRRHIPAVVIALVAKEVFRLPNSFKVTKKFVAAAQEGDVRIRYSSDQRSLFYEGNIAAERLENLNILIEQLPKLGGYDHDSYDTDSDDDSEASSIGEDEESLSAPLTRVVHATSNNLEATMSLPINEALSSPIANRVRGKRSRTQDSEPSAAPQKKKKKSI